MIIISTISTISIISNTMVIKLQSFIDYFDII